MKPSSQFFFIGASVLTLAAFATANWALLLLPVLLMLCALACADGEQQRSLSDDTEGAAMFLSHAVSPLLPLDYFITRDFVGYRAGYPVYRLLISGRGTHWQLLAHEDDLDTMPVGAIRVFPGFVYQKSNSAA